MISQASIQNIVTLFKRESFKKPITGYQGYHNGYRINDEFPVFFLFAKGDDYKGKNAEYDDDLTNFHSNIKRKYGGIKFISGKANLI